MAHPTRDSVHGGDASRTMRLFDEGTGREIGQISEAEFAFLQDVLEEEGPDDADYWINPDTVDLLESRGATPYLVSLLRAAVGDGPDGIDVAFQREGEPRRGRRGSSRRDETPAGSRGES